MRSLATITATTNFFRYFVLLVQWNRWSHRSAFGACKHIVSYRRPTLYRIHTSRVEFASAAWTGQLPQHIHLFQVDSMQLNRLTALKLFGLQIFCRRQSWVVENSIRFADADATVLSGLACRCEWSIRDTRMLAVSRACCLVLKAS